MRELELGHNTNAAAGRSRSNSRAPVSARGASASARAPLADRNNEQPHVKPPLTGRDSNVAAPPATRDPRTAALMARLNIDVPRSAAAALAPPSTSAVAALVESASTPSTPITTPRGADGLGTSWQEAMAKHASALTAYEAKEIQQYPTVYYAGQRCSRKVHGVELAGTNNHGYDDAQGDFKVVMDDHVAFRYQVLAPLGRGSFGQVSKAIDHKTGKQVALKIIKNKKKFHEQAVIEVKVLKHLNAKDVDGSYNVVRMLNSFKFRNHMVIAFELQGMSLYDLHKTHRFAPMTEAAIRTFARQMLQTLVLTHKEHVVHCDLKPENVLLEPGSKTKLCVIDFGSSCFDSERLYTYIQSRFYRAPEILLGIPYTPAIDVWSLGCMLAEFSNGYPLFPGESETQQMLLVMETLGLPPRSMLDRAPRRKVFFDANNAPKLTPNARGKTPRPSTKNLADFLQSANPDFLDLLKGLLEYEPERRLTPSEALRHPFFGDRSAVEPVSGLLPKLQPPKLRR
jgi:dual specificity tyrosine-phosphorylation-regulated kinase 2/3/4